MHTAIYSMYTASGIIVYLGQKVSHSPKCKHNTSPVNRFSFEYQYQHIILIGRIRCDQESAILSLNKKE